MAAKLDCGTWMLRLPEQEPICSLHEHSTDVTAPPYSEGEFCFLLPSVELHHVTDIDHHFRSDAEMASSTGQQGTCVHRGPLSSVSMAVYYTARDGSSTLRQFQPTADT
jgi:hypothetical protein